MVYVVMYGLAGAFTLMMVMQRRFLSAAIVWGLLSLGLVMDGFIGDAVVGLGAVLLVLGSVGLTRGQIYAGSPRRETHGPDPSIFRDDVHQALQPPSDEPVDDVNTQSTELTHPFWGPD